MTFNSLYFYTLLQNHFQASIDFLPKNPDKFVLHEILDGKKYSEIAENKKILRKLMTTKVHHNKIFVYGSAASGKSVAIIQYLLYLVCNEKNHSILVCRKVASTISISTFPTFISVMREYGIAKKVNCKINETSKTIEINGNMIYFKGLDDPDKLLSAVPFSIIWIEEADQVFEEDVDTLITRQRGAKQKRKEMIFSTNPPNINHFLIKRFLNNISDENPLIIWANYQVNRHNLTESDIANLERFKHINRKKYERYCLGLPTEYDDRTVFSNVTYISDSDYENLIPEAVAYGIDYGSAAPSVLGEFKIVGNKLFGKELIYKERLGLGVFEKRVIETVQSRYPKAPIYADIANPTNNQYLMNAGLNVQNVNKNIAEGISVLQLCEIYITHSSTNAKLEMQSYLFDEKVNKKTGVREILETISSSQDHFVDVMRYVAKNNNKLQNNLTHLYGLKYRGLGTFV